MRVILPTRRAILGMLSLPMTTFANSDGEVLTSVGAMETRDSLTIFAYRDAMFHRWRGAQRHDGGLTIWPAISPDGLALSWIEEFPDARRVASSTLRIENLRDGVRTVSLDGQVANGLAISRGAETIVVSTLSIAPRGRRSLLVLDLASGAAIQNLTSLVTQFELPDLEQISVSGPGTLVALGSREQIQVLEIPSGKTVYAGPGRFPRLSPDGTRLAFVKQEHLYIRSLADGGTNEMLPDTRVMGIGGWSPDGRFLLAGAWTRALAFEKRQIVVDTTNGHYGEIGKLGEGDYGHQFVWISTMLIAR